MRHGVWFVEEYLTGTSADPWWVLSENDTTAWCDACEVDVDAAGPCCCACPVCGWNDCCCEERLR